jgi:hypothetical protein
MIGPNIKVETIPLFGPDRPVVFCTIYTMLGTTATPAPTSAPIAIPITFFATIIQLVNIVLFTIFLPERKTDVAV